DLALYGRRFAGRDVSSSFGQFILQDFGRDRWACRRGTTALLSGIVFEERRIRGRRGPAKLCGTAGGSRGRAGRGASSSCAFVFTLRGAIFKSIGDASDLSGDWCTGGVETGSRADWRLFEIAHQHASGGCAG